MEENPFEIDIGDGEIEYKPSIWKERVDQYRVRPEVMDYADYDRQQSQIQRKEVALKHPLTDAALKMNDDGTVDLFGNDRAGIRIDPLTNSLYLYGDNVHVFSHNTRIRTNPLGLEWNNTRVYPHEDVFIDRKDLSHHSPEMKALMSKFEIG